METREEIHQQFRFEDDENDLQITAYSYWLEGKYLSLQEKKLSLYNIAHCELNSSCCGIFMTVNEEGVVICNECGMDLRTALKPQEQKPVEVDWESIKRNPETNDGWNFDYEFIKKISHKTDDYDFSVGMEEVDSVLMALLHFSQPIKPMEWISVEDRLPEYGIPVIGYNEKWINPDWYPEGMSECHLFDEGEWCVPVWNPEFDEWETRTSMDFKELIPTHWQPMPNKPITPKQ